MVSYVNNLHPRHQEVYRALEEIMSASIRMWNEVVLFKIRQDGSTGDLPQTGRHPLRIVTYGPGWRDGLPKWAQHFYSVTGDCSKFGPIDEFTEAYRTAFDAAQRIPDQEERKHAINALRVEARRTQKLWMDVPAIPGPTEEDWVLAEQYPQRSLTRGPPGSGEEWDVCFAIEQEANRRRYWEHPQPSTAFSYQEWAAGRNVEKAVVPMIRMPWYADEDREGFSTLGEPHHKRRDVRLEDAYRESGLQIIVDIGGVDLNAGQSHRREWQVPGHLNEHIIATAVYVYDCSNIDCRTSFSQTTYMPERIFRYSGIYPERCKTDDPPTFNWDNRDHYSED